MESSALVYVGLTIVTVLLACHVQSFVQVGRGTRGYARSSVAEFAIFVLLTGVSACRIAVGNDYWVYRFNFRLIAQERHVSSEFGFNLIVKWMQQLFGYDNYLPIFALFSALTVWFFVRALHGQAADYAFSFFLLMTGGYYFNSLNTVRYYLALAVALYAMRYVLRGEYGKFVLWILFGSLFHKSVLLVIPVYWVAHRLALAKLKTWHYVAETVLAASLIFGQNIYREIVFFFYPYYRDSGFDAGNVSWVNVAKCVGTLLLCAICYRRSLRENVANRFYFFLNVAGLMVYPCGSFIPEVSRVGYYMIASQIFLIPALLKDMPKGWFRKLCYGGVATCFGVYFVFLLRGMYATDIRLLPYLNWIFN
ncbi:MAG: EpsG family protein [Clostridium sp.]|nr:EpsG family protein [Acetatifactor muris]MCM1526739.1 EpsG family protein [Bacteroides sp.]MCM1562801.1 EpsG family protein [Clostridium sp.]